LEEAASRLALLTHQEIKVLSSQSAQLVGEMLGQHKINSSPATCQAIVQECLTALSKPSSYPLNSLSQSARLRLLPPSPQLVTARGFKTKARTMTGSGFSAFNKKKQQESEGSGLPPGDQRFKEVLNKLNISPAEKEKVHVAFLSYAAAAGGKPGEKLKEDKKTFMNFNFDNWLSRGANLAIISSVFLALAMYTGMTLFKGFSRGGNEIAPEDIEVTFEDVKGCDEAKLELQEVVDFLMNPEKFSALGGKLPKGCLLVGPPGTGKTLLARAVAGQAGVPFFYASGSEFDEVLVGQGARRVRDLFKAAKERAPCVIFLDEIDSVGSKRSSSELHPYANQTINQLLSEMDGFVSNEGVIVLGATNRAGDLDKALLRPGRFDTQVDVKLPDSRGRREILELYLAKIKTDDTLAVETLAARTTGFSGADLQNLVNSAAIRAAGDNKQWVTMADLDIAYDKIVMGSHLKSRIRPKEDLEITAYHEAGHTLVAYFTKEAKPLHKVTLLAMGASGGHTAFTPTESMQWHQTKAQMKADMDVSMGGRVAEEIIFGKEKVTGGASSDLQSATRTAEMMVKYLGMSDKVGLRVENDNNNNDISPAAKELRDTEIKMLLDDSYRRASSLLHTRKKELVLLAEALLKYETLDAEDVKCIVEQKRPLSPKSPSQPPSGTPLGSMLQPVMAPLGPSLPGLGVGTTP